MHQLLSALLLTFTIPAHAEVYRTSYTQDSSCHAVRGWVQEAASRREMLLWRGEGKDEFNMAYPAACPLRGWYSERFYVETQDQAECFVGYCCSTRRGAGCR